MLKVLSFVEQTKVGPGTLTMVPGTLTMVNPPGASGLNTATLGLEIELWRKGQRYVRLRRTHALHVVVTHGATSSIAYRSFELVRM